MAAFIYVVVKSLDELIRSLGLLIEYVGMFIVIASVVVSLVKLPMKQYTMEEVRINLAKRIIFGLEFIIAADILLATIALDVQEILKLGAIVAIRILLGYTLRKEVA